MKIITCASFYGSGSSALTDLVAEYSCVKDLTNYEFRFLYDIDGVSDLEHYLCECHDRHNAGHALKRFKRLSEFNAGTFFNARYEPFFNNQYMKLTRKFIDSIIDFSYPGWWFYDVYDKGKVLYYILIQWDKILRKLTNGKKSILSRERIFCSHPSQEKFIESVQNYVASLMQAANPEGLPFLEVDQLVPSQNLNRILRYFSDDITVFIVDRDPRDVYTSNRFYWKENICPTDDVNTFCDWFLYTRKSGKVESYNTNQVIKLRFEDMIYKYDETVAKIEMLTGLDNSLHSMQFKKFNPQQSVNNTQIWKKHNIEVEIKVIEERLAEYLYPFDEVNSDAVPGVKQEDGKIF
ncbi:hypothetical protein ACS60V_05400 [Streptococcus suis]|uniref:Sulfotransferase domain-containing protein n=2 Tax=Streptococcus TaxID=1301 RepID=A0AA87K4L3_STRSU|nr:MULTISPECIES: hypothetical protein [Streptococcus]EHC03584.1 hypothetical protein SSUR61_0580 [Streptococcus suis R61]MCK4029666.1 hypothetical protein [Streptococcus suis]WNY48502.1 hypothetical protein PW220_07145 [Streptococcus sp. 29892]HEL2402209.1 hypothetical protein [Streptococcus suis]HEM4129122.1 hypothetical protein [Streptococcus suis]